MSCLPVLVYVKHTSRDTTSTPKSGNVRPSSMAAVVETKTILRGRKIVKVPVPGRTS